MTFKKSPYSNLKAEMARTNLDIKDIADAIGKSYQTTHAKVTGTSDLSLNEALLIKSLLKTTMPLETLFAR